MSKQSATDRGKPSAHHDGHGEDRDLATELAELARSLQQEPDADAVLAGFVTAALRLILGADEGSVSVVLNRKKVGSRVPSGPLPERIDALQVETGEGPCLQAAYEHQTVRVPDMGAE